ncbi:ribbon-helix-helix domain-containing protein [Domibacillus mangrovi]|nr:ribbon-helix-helix domain-containing protein [Domibacillus mangrovi]
MIWTSDDTKISMSKLLDEAIEDLLAKRKFAN